MLVFVSSGSSRFFGRPRFPSSSLRSPQCSFSHLNDTITITGTHMQTGEEVGIKLVRKRERKVKREKKGDAAIENFDSTSLLNFSPSRGHTLSLSLKKLSPRQQEWRRSRHPQLLYESKLYKILQGGREFSMFFFFSFLFSSLVFDL